MNFRKMNSGSSFDDSDYNSEEISSDEEENIKKPLQLTKKTDNTQELPSNSTSEYPPRVLPRISPGFLNKPSQKKLLSSSSESSSCLL